MRGNISLRTLLVFSLAVAILGLAAGPAGATDLYWDGGTTDIVTDGDGNSAGGTGTWDTTILNWDQGASPHVAWVNANNDTAVFGGTAGTVTLGEPITFGGMTFDTAGYTIANGGNTLTFDTGTITANADVTIGDITKLGNIVLDGTGNGTIASITDGDKWGDVRKYGTGTWTIEGEMRFGHGYLYDGDLVLNGEAWSDYRNFFLNAGTLHYNNPGALRFVGARYLQMSGGNLDNTSGAAITESTHNPGQWWYADFTFVGSNGADSDLHMGNGTVTMNATRTVTVQNPETTFTVGGVISDGGSGYGLTKAGDGTLAITGFTNYTGTTTVAAGTLRLGDDANSTNLADNAFLYVDSGALLDLNFTGMDDVFFLTLGGTPADAGTWGATGAIGVDYTSPFLTGTGILNNIGGQAPAGTWYYDGPNVGGTGDGASAGGDGTWSTSVANWDQGVTTRKAWNNTTADKAVFSGTAGTVTLDSDITLGELVFDSAAGDGYVITGHNLNFGGAATITAESAATIESGITGSPTVAVSSGASVTLAPTGASMALGTINPVGSLTLGGTTTGNSVVAIPKAGGGGIVYKNGPGTWTVNGDCYGGYIYVNGGTLIVNGKLYTDYRDLTINNGGTVVINGTFDPRDNDAVNFNAGGTMKGTGTIIGPMTAGPMNVKAGAILAPGFPTGTLTIENADCTIAGTLAVGGTLDISAETATLEIIETSAGTGDMVIATYTTLIGSVFATVNGLSTGWEIDYAYNEGTAIALTGGILLGDADDNGVVNAADYIILKTNMGQTTGATTAEGDFDDDGDVDWGDLQLLQDNYGATSAGATGTIPEPGSAILLMFGAAALLRRRAVAERIRQ